MNQSRHPMRLASGGAVVLRFPRTSYGLVEAPRARQGCGPSGRSRRPDRDLLPRVADASRRARCRPRSASWKQPHWVSRHARDQGASRSGLALSGPEGQILPPATPWTATRLGSRRDPWLEDAHADAAERHRRSWARAPRRISSVWHGHR